jgi:hypothetical protein
MILGEGVERHQRAVEVDEPAAVVSGSHAERREAETGHEFRRTAYGIAEWPARASVVLSDEECVLNLKLRISSHSY